MTHYLLREWESVPIGLGAGEIHPEDADRLAGAAQVSGFARRDGAGVLEYGRQHLRARGIVGLITAHGCSLEILPKIDSLDTEGALRQKLVHMLDVAYGLKIDLGPITRYTVAK